MSAAVKPVVIAAGPGPVHEECPEITTGGCSGNPQLGPRLLGERLLHGAMDTAVSNNARRPLMATEEGALLPHRATTEEEQCSVQKVRAALKEFRA